MEICTGCGGAGCKACKDRQAPKLFLPIEPMPYKRTTQKQKFVDPAYKKYMEYKQAIGLMAGPKIRMIDKGLPVSIDVTFYMPIPKSGKITVVDPYTSKRKQVEVVEGRPHIFTPDADNLIKGLFDALNKIAWADDNQVYEIKSRKVYSDYPGIELGIEYLGG